MNTHMPCTFMKVSIDDFVAEVRLDFPDATEELMQGAVRNAAWRFCQRTAVLECDLVVNLQKGQTNYPLEVDDCDLMVHNVVHPEDGCAPRWLAAYRNGCWCCGAFTFDVPDPSYLVLHSRPVEDKVDGLHIRVTLKPVRQACAFPKLLYDEHVDAIRKGAKAYLYGLRGFPWSDQRDYDKCDREFRGMMNSAKIRQLQRNTEGNQTRIRAERMI